MSISQPIPISLEEIDDIVLPDPRPRRNMYVDNAQLSQEMTKWRRAIDEAKKLGKDRPQMPDYVAKCVLLIAENMTKKISFSSYSWRDEMVGDAIYACCRYIHSFNPDAPTRGGKPNAYGYISMCVEHSFKHTIKSEKQEMYFKDKAFEALGGVGAFSDEDLEHLGEGAGQMMVDMIDRVYEYENKQKERVEKDREKRKAKEQTLSLFDMFGTHDTLAEVEAKHDGEFDEMDEGDDE